MSALEDQGFDAAWKAFYVPDHSRGDGACL